MGKLRERLRHRQDVAQSAKQETGWNREITELLERVDSTSKDEDRKKMNREISKLQRLLSRRYPGPQIKTFQKALRHNKRFAWEEHSNEPVLQVLDPETAAKYGGLDNAWYWLSIRQVEAVMMPCFLAQKMARCDRAANYLHAQYLGENHPEVYCDYCRFRIGRALVALLAGNYSNGSHRGEIILANLLSDVPNRPTREMARAILDAGVMDYNEPNTFLSKLYADVPGAEQAVEQLLTLYNILVRAETLQRYENASKKARRHRHSAPHNTEPVLSQTETERRLLHSRKGSGESEFWLRVSAPLLFKCSPDNLCKVVNFPQKRGRLIVREVLGVDCNASHE